MFSYGESIFPEPYVPVYKYESLNGKYAFLREKRDFDGYEGIGVYKIIKSKDDKAKYELVWKFTDFEKRLNKEKKYIGFRHIMFFVSNNGSYLTILNGNEKLKYFLVLENDSIIKSLKADDIFKKRKCYIDTYYSRSYKVVKEGIVSLEVICPTKEMKLNVNLISGKILSVHEKEVPRGI